MKLRSEKKTGLFFDADYNSSYSNRSIPDKLYMDGMHMDGMHISKLVKLKKILSKL